MRPVWVGKSTFEKGVCRIPMKVGGTLEIHEVDFMDTHKEMPPFFPEFFSILRMVSADGPLWKDRYITDGVLEFGFPITSAAERLAKKVAELHGYNVLVKSPEYISYDIKSVQQDGWQVCYSGGKESGLSACILSEIYGKDRVNLSSAVATGPIEWFPPDNNLRRFRFSPGGYQTTPYTAVAVVHALWNGAGVVVKGYEYNLMIVDHRNAYMACSAPFISEVNTYLSEVCDVKAATVVNQLPTNVCQKILHERYPAFRQTFKKSAYQRLINMYHGIPVDDSYKPLSGYDERSISRMIFCAERDHIMASMGIGSEKTYPWVDRFMRREASPTVKVEGLESIFREHVEPDDGYHLNYWME